MPLFAPLMVHAPFLIRVAVLQTGLATLAKYLFVLVSTLRIPQYALAEALAPLLIFAIVFLDL